MFAFSSVCRESNLLFSLNLNSFLTSLQRKTLFIALAALTCIAACLTSLFCYIKNRKIAHLNHLEENRQLKSISHLAPHFKSKNEKNESHDTHMDESQVLEENSEKCHGGDNLKNSSKNLRINEEQLLENLPDQILIKMIGYFTPHSYYHFSHLNKNCFRLSRDRKVIDSVFFRKTYFIDPEIKSRIAIMAGTFLKKLKLSALIKEKRMVEIFAACPKIQYLTLSSSPLAPLIDKLPKTLKTLDLMSCKLDQVDYSKLPETLENLRIVHLLKNDDIQKLPRNLKSLDISDCQLTDETIEHLPPDLHSLNLSGCGTNISADALDKLPKKLKTLNLARWRSLSDQSIDKLPKTLLSLNLHGCRELTDSSMTDLPQDLRHLVISGCTKLTDEAIKNLPPDLQSLEMTGCQITDQGFKNQLRKLKSLIFVNSNHLTDAFFDSLPDGLQKLEITWSPSFSIKSLQKLPLLELHLSDANNLLSDNDIQYLPRSLIKLTLEQNKALTIAMIPDLPPYLLSVDLSGCSQDLVDYMRKNLSHLNSRN